MTDLFYLALVAAFFAITGGLVRLAGSLMGGGR